MAKKKIKKEITIKYRYTAHCAHCKDKFKSNNLDNIPSYCQKCGFSIVVNDSYYLLSRTKEELLNTYKEIENAAV